MANTRPPVRRFVATDIGKHTGMPERIRVAMVHGAGLARHDGVSDHVGHLIKALHQVDVEAVGVTVGQATRGGWLAGTVRAAREVRQLRPDVIHVQFAPSAYRFSAAPGWLPPLLPRVAPLVTTVHEYGWWAAPGWLPEAVWRPLERHGLWDRETGRLVPASRAVVVSNSDHATRVRRRMGIEPVEVPLAPNVDPDLQQPDPQEPDHQEADPPWRDSLATSAMESDLRRAVRYQLGLGPETFLLVFFGFVHPVKGLRYVLQALPALRSAREDLHLALVGGFTSQALPQDEARAFRAELEELAVRHGVQESMTFTGHLPAAQVSRILSAADAAVLPFTAGVTLKSGSLLATLAHGVPTAVTLPDQPEYRLRDGENVVVIPRRRNADAVGAALRRLLLDEALRRRLAAGGRALAAGHSWPEVAAAHRAVYERVLAGST